LAASVVSDVMISMSGKTLIGDLDGQKPAIEKARHRSRVFEFALSASSASMADHQIRIGIRM
jgi:hypothetical protein